MSARLYSILISLASVMAFVACGPKETVSEESVSELELVRIQADWYAQTEHGGYHQGKEKGIYEKYGIEIEILGAGPNMPSMQKVARGDADFGMYRFDSLVQAIDKGMPVVCVAGTMYHDPGAFMVHADSPVTSFGDLDGRDVMLVVGAPFETFFRKKYGVEFKAYPFTWGYGEFMVNKDLTQQCYITNEAYFVRREGVEVRTIPFYTSGYDPIRTLYANKKFLREKPDLARRFIAASIESWRDFLESDPAPAIASIRRDNPKLSVEHINYAYDVLKKENYFLASPEEDWAFGSLPDEKMRHIVRILKDIEVVRPELTLEDCIDRSFLPTELAMP